MLRPVTVAAVVVEDLDAVAVVHGADAVRALDAAWNERLRALAPAPAAVFTAGPGEAVVALPASSPDLGQDAPPSRLRPLVFMARDPGTGRVHEVRVTGDGGSPSTLGPLGPLWEALEDEVLGGWSP
jgi:hypothetical protein